MGSDYAAEVVAGLQQRVLRLEAELKTLETATRAAIRQTDNNGATAFKRLGSLEDRITELETQLKETEDE